MIVNWLVVLIIGSVVGAFTGLMLGGLIGELYLAIIAGILATIIAGTVRHVRVPQLVNIYFALDTSHRIPLPVIIYSAIASLAGSAAAVQVATISELTSSSVGIATLAGFFAGILMAILITVYHMNQPPTGGSS